MLGRKRPLEEHVRRERQRWLLLASALADLADYALVAQRHAVAKSATNRSRELERRLAQATGALFEDAGREVLAELRRQGRIPTAPDGRMKLRNALTKVLDRLADTMEPEVMEAAEHGKNRVVNALRRGGMSVDLDELPSATAERMREHVFEASQRTIQRVDDDIMQRLATMEEEGLGIDDVADRLQERFDQLSESDAERIARTEINGAQNEGAFETERELGVNFHQWITAEDDRVRGHDPEDAGDHVSLHGIIVRVGDPFPNGLAYPGERIGDEAEWINCRCRAVPFLMPEDKRAPTGMDHFTESDLEEDE